MVGNTLERRGRNRGQSLVEFAVAIPILLLLLAAIADLGRAFYFEVTTADAARAATREAIGQPQSQKQGPGLAAVCAAATADLKNVPSVTCGRTASTPNANQAVVVVNCPDSGGSCSGIVGAAPLNGVVTVDVYYGFALVMPGITNLVPGGVIQIHNTARMVTSW